jgi:hypothetical protein
MTSTKLVSAISSTTSHTVRVENPSRFGSASSPSAQVAPERLLLVLAPRLARLLVQAEVLAGADREAGGPENAHGLSNTLCSIPF